MSATSFAQPGRLVLAAVLLWSGAAVAEDKFVETVGLAFDLGSDELLYRETHCLSADGREREVTYQDAADRFLARKWVDYRSGTTTPSFVQYNHYSQKSIEVAPQRDGISMAVVSREDPEENMTTLAQPSDELPVVIDAGFDDFVRTHWDALVGGENREFQFPFASQEGLVELRISPRACTYDTTTDQCFQLDLANWFLRLLVKPIELGYDAETRRLSRYRGLSNIGDGNGNGLVVDIRYQYDDVEPSACQLIDQTLTVTIPGDLRDAGAS